MDMKIQRFKCPHCGRELKENLYEIPFRWMCHYCGGLYSIIVVADEIEDEDE